MYVCMCVQFYVCCVYVCSRVSVFEWISIESSTGRQAGRQAGRQVGRQAGRQSVVK